jgi:hypothetical protein
VTTNLQSNGSGGSGGSSGGMRRNYSANSTPYSHLEPHSNGNSAAGGFQVRSCCCRAPGRRVGHAAPLAPLATLLTTLPADPSSAGL